TIMFKGDTAMQVALSHISEPPPLPSAINASIPKSVERELLKALEKEPEKRHPKSSDFIEKATWGLAAALLVLCLVAAVLVGDGAAASEQLLTQ
ncbi:MAG TPA: hypothetical protein PLL53_06310, partial [Saprospiraceae bacterium]|nr:hypothetical protein [Saprospiraceae bacterium]